MHAKEQQTIHLARIINAALKGDLEGNDKLLMEQWLNSSPANQALFDSFKEEDNLVSKLNEYALIDSQQDCQRFMDLYAARRKRGVAPPMADVNTIADASEKMKAAKRAKRLYLMAGSAAAVVVLCVVATLTLMPQRDLLQQLPSSVLAEVAIPTVYTYQQDSILSADALDLENPDAFLAVDKLQEAPGDQEPLAVEEQQKPKYTKIVIPSGYVYRVQLPDGTKVTLNAGSELSYPSKFQDEAREVEFRGEGFFEVAKAAAPFIIRSENTQVKVYGTTFNYLYSNVLSLAEVVLLEGSVGMSVNDLELMISAGERIHHMVGQDMLSVDKVDPSNYLGWLGSTFRYQDASLERIAYDLSCWYGITIILTPEVKRQTRTYTIEFDKSTPVERIMYGLMQLSDNTLTKKGGVLMVH